MRRLLLGILGLVATLGLATLAGATPAASVADRVALRGIEPREELVQDLGSLTEQEATPSAASRSAAYVGERTVEADWLAEREAALVAIRADYEAARHQTLAAPGVGPGWQATAFVETGENGQLSSASGRSSVWVADPDAAQEFVGWDEGRPEYRPVGRWVEFDEEAFAAYYRALEREPLQRLAALYDPSGGADAGALLAVHPELWSIAIAEHALNAGPATAGVAMADAGLLGIYDLYLTDPQMAALVDAYGGDPAPATGAIATEQARLFGERRFEQMSRLSNALATVRARYFEALDQRRQRGDGPGWVERERTLVVYDEGGVTRTMPMYVTDDWGGLVYDASGQPLVLKERVFDPDAFTDWYLGQGGLPHQAFAALYGRSHSQFYTESRETGDGGSGSTSTVSTTTFDNPNWSLSAAGAFEHRAVFTIDPNNPPRLRDDRLVGFDFEAGWASPHANYYQRGDWFETAMQVAFVAAVSYVSYGTLGAEAGAAASSAASSAGASAASATAIGAAAQGAAVGAAASMAGGVVSGDLKLKSVLQGALAGGLSAGVMNSVLAETVNAAAGTAGTLGLRVTVQGGIQELLGGGFSQGARAALAAGLADEAGANFKAGIDQAVATGAMSASEATAARTFGRLLCSAIRAAGNPDDPRQAFASAFLSETVRAAVEAPAVTQTPPDASPAVPTGDPFLSFTEEDGPGRPEDLADVGWLEDSGRSFRRSAEFLCGFAEGATFSVLDQSRAVLEILRSPGPFITGVKVLLASAEARAQLGDEVIDRVRADVFLFEEAWKADDMRALGQQLGKLTTDLAQVAGGVQALGRLGISTASAGGRLVLRATDAVANGRVASAVGAFRIGEKAADLASVVGKDQAIFFAGSSGEAVAGAVADELAASSGMTLNRALDKLGVEIPRLNPGDPASVKFWVDWSVEFARNAQGEVRTVIGSDVRQGSIFFQYELPELLRNPNVTKIIQIDPLTRVEKVIWTRP